MCCQNVIFESQHSDQHYYYYLFSSSAFLRISYKGRERGVSIFSIKFEQMNGPESTSRWHFPKFVAEIHSQQIDEVHLQPQIRVSKNRIDLQPQIRLPV